MRRIERVLLACSTLLAVASAVPPLGNWLMHTMLTQMLVQIPLLFVIAAIWGQGKSRPAEAPWRAWNAQGAPGLLAAAFVLVFWMTPIALDHTAADWHWETAKIISVAGAGFLAGLSWRLGSAVTHIFFLGNMLWMSVTVGVLYQESTQRYCNAYLWDDQVMTGKGLVAASIGLALIWALRATRTSRRAKSSSLQ